MTDSGIAENARYDLNELHLQTVCPTCGLVDDQCQCWIEALHDCGCSRYLCPVCNPPRPCPPEHGGRVIPLVRRVGGGL